VDSVFDHLQQTGLKVLRTWGFNDVNSIPSSGTVYFQLHGAGSKTTTINTGPDGLQRLDYVVDAAERYGIKLIIPFVNNWNDYGGMNAYVNAYGGDKVAWYTNAKIQSVYRAYIAAVVARYRDSPAIFAWELGNEPRCQGCNTDVIYNWTKDFTWLPLVKVRESIRGRFPSSGCYQSAKSFTHRGDGIDHGVGRVLSIHHVRGKRLFEEYRDPRYRLWHVPPLHDGL
jgi:hypothetical protein